MEGTQTTLAEYRQRPALSLLDLSKVPVGTVVQKYKGFGKPLISPSVAAAEFYGPNAVVARILQELGPGEPLGKYQSLLERYQAIVQTHGVRMYYYLLLIITRESRHHHLSPTRLKQYRAKYGSAAVDYLVLLQGKSEHAAVDYLLSCPPKVNMATWSAFLTEVFPHGGFIGSTGGPLWGRIAYTLYSFVSGQTTMEMMLDTAFTLAHNGGPMFNKGYVYQYVSHHDLNRVLNAQYKGVVPNLIYEGRVRVDHDVRRFMQDARKLFPGEFTAPAGEIDIKNVNQPTFVVPAEILNFKNLEPDSEPHFHMSLHSGCGISQGDIVTISGVFTSGVDKSAGDDTGLQHVLDGTPILQEYIEKQSVESVVSKPTTESSKVTVTKIGGPSWL